MKIDNTLVITTLAVMALVIIAIAAVYVTPGNTTTATPQPEKLDWFGAVTDTFGRPYGGINVTLHLMTPTGEAYNLTNRTCVDLPYPGSYVFDNVSLSPDMTYAYATAESGDLGDGVVYYGRGENYTLSTSRLAAGFVVLHVPMPDSIAVTAENATLRSSGVVFVNDVGNDSLPDSTLINAQLYLNGQPYKRAGITVTFFGEDEGIVAFPGVRTGVTDESGRTSILLTSGSPGTTNVTAYTRIGISRNVTGYCLIQVVDR